MMIEDGQGTGDRTHVNANGCLCVRATTIHFLQRVNELHQEAYTAIIEKTPTAAGDCFFYIINNSTDDMYISSMTAAVATDETIQLYINDVGTPAGTTANTLVNRNAGSGKAADCTAYDGVNITGLSGGKKVEQFAVDGNIGSQKWRYSSCIIIPKNHTFTLYATTGAIALSISLGIAFYKPS